MPCAVPVSKFVARKEGIGLQLIVTADEMAGVIRSPL